MTRLFTHRLATRDKMPLLVGLVGPSSSGKTYSALELATGFQRVNPGEIFLIDTEAGRSLAYAERFRFVHVPFGAPFSPLDYLDVIKYCVDQGATNIIVDSLSHEHEGPGGVLEWHATEMGGNYAKQMLAWAKPKAARRRLINEIMQLNVNFIFCLRAKPKIKLPPKGSPKGSEPTDMGYQPIGGDEWIYEMSLNMLLLPRANGVPTWHSDLEGEKAILKLPRQFESIFADRPQLSADVGEKLARWAAGSSATPKMSAATLIRQYAACSEPSEFRRLEEVRRVSWASLTAAEKPSVKAASEQAAKRIEDAAKAPEPQPDVDDFEETTTSAAAS